LDVSDRIGTCFLRPVSAGRLWAALLVDGVRLWRNGCLIAAPGLCVDRCPGHPGRAADRIQGYGARGDFHCRAVCRNPVPALGAAPDWQGAVMAAARDDGRLGESSSGFHRRSGTARRVCRVGSSRYDSGGHPRGRRRPSPASLPVARGYGRRDACQSMGLACLRHHIPPGSRHGAALPVDPGVGAHTARLGAHQIRLVAVRARYVLCAAGGCGPRRGVGAGEPANWSRDPAGRGRYFSTPASSPYGALQYRGCSYRRRRAGPPPAHFRIEDPLGARPCDSRCRGECAAGQAWGRCASATW